MFPVHLNVKCSTHIVAHKHLTVASLEYYLHYSPEDRSSQLLKNTIIVKCGIGERSPC